MSIDISSLRIVPALTLKGIPWSQVVPYVGRLKNGVTFAIFHPAEDWNYSDFRCLFGATDGTVKEVGVKKVMRYRDGGTTDIETVCGDFHFPSPFNADDKATFDGEELFIEKR